MIVALLVIIIGMAWLLKETDWLRCNLMGEISEPIQMIEWRKTQPILEPCDVKTMAYPKTYLLPEMCEMTHYQVEFKESRYRRYSYNGTDPINRDSYQQMIIGEHTLTLLATSPKLYKTITEMGKTWDTKPRKVTSHRSIPLPNFVRNEQTGSHQEWIPRKTWNEDGTVTEDKKHGYHQTVCEYTTYFDNCLCGKEWLEAHYQDVIPEPTMELIVNGKELHINGNYKTGLIKEFCKTNKMAWE